MKNKILSILLFSLFLSGFFACTETGPQSTETGPKFSEIYNAGLSRGDLLEVKIDTSNLTYSYEVKEGDLKGQVTGKGSGSLKRLHESGPNAFETDQGAFVLAIENKVVIGAVGEDFYVGVPKADRKIGLQEIAGDYNFVSYLPKGLKDDPNNLTIEGTLRIKENGEGLVMLDANLSEADEENSIKITLTSQDNSIFNVNVEENGKTIEVANFLPKVEEHGEIFAVIDFSNNKIMKGIGFAQKQKLLKQNALDGNYIAYVTMSEGITKAVVKGTELILNDENFKDAAVNLTLNHPWTGVVHGRLENKFDFYGIYSGAELYSIVLNHTGVPPQAFVAVKQ